MGRSAPLFKSIVETNSLEEVREAFGWGHPEMLVDDCNGLIISLRQLKGEIEPTRTNDASQCFEARLNLPTFPAGDHGLRLQDPIPEVSLGQAGPQPSFANQITANHGSNYSTNLL
jgi:hypothetical protein